MLRLLTDKEFYDIYTRYMEKDFPENELKPMQMIIDAPYEYCYGYEDDEGLKGYCIVMLNENCCLLDYLAVYPQYRQQGIGSIILKELKELFSNKNIMIESEQPYDLTSKLRIQFYSKNGFIQNTASVKLYFVDYYIFSSFPLTSKEIYDIYASFYPPALIENYLNVQ